MLKAKLLCPDGQTSCTVTIYVATYWFYYFTYPVHIKSYLYYENVESNSVTIDRINRIELGLCLHWSIFWAGWNHIAVRPLSSGPKTSNIIIDCGYRALAFAFGDDRVIPVWVYNRPMNVMNGRAHRENSTVTEVIVILNPECLHYIDSAGFPRASRVRDESDDGGRITINNQNQRQPHFSYRPLITLISLMDEG